MNKTIKQIEEDIIELADVLDNKEELWYAWKKLDRAMRYLSAKRVIVEIKKPKKHKDTCMCTECLG